MIFMSEGSTFRLPTPLPGVGRAPVVVVLRFGSDDFFFRPWPVDPPPSFFALDRANRSPHALHNSFLPDGPFLHSGLEVAPQLEHSKMPDGRFPEPLPPGVDVAVEAPAAAPPGWY